jgi:hypothetical protein
VKEDGSKGMVELMEENNRLRELLHASQVGNSVLEMSGMSAGEIADAKKRVNQGLPMHHAIQAARSQAINDKLVLEQEKRDALKLAQSVEVVKAKQRLAALEAEHELEHTNARIAELEAKKTEKKAA